MPHFVFRTKGWGWVTWRCLLYKLLNKKYSFPVLERFQAVVLRLILRLADSFAFDRKLQNYLFFGDLHTFARFGNLTWIAIFIPPESFPDWAVAVICGCVLAAVTIAVAVIAEIMRRKNLPGKINSIAARWRQSEVTFPGLCENNFVRGCSGLEFQSLVKVASKIPLLDVKIILHSAPDAQFLNKLIVTSNMMLTRRRFRLMWRP